MVDKTHTTKVSDHKTSAPVWQAVVLSIFPEMFPGPLAHSLAGQAHERGIWSLQTVDIRDHSSHKHRSVDDTPFGGGAGMVMRPDVVSQAIEAARQLSSPDMPLIYLTPRGRPLDQQRVRTLAQGDGAIILCGRFEGIDQRVLEAHDVEEVSLGDFVLSGGEIAAQALLDACVRLLPDVIGSEASLEEESFETGLLEYPHYTRPRDWHDRLVPEVLLSGHHANITAWRHEQAITITRERRPDLWHRYAETEHKI